MDFDPGRVFAVMKQEFNRATIEIKSYKETARARFYTRLDAYFAVAVHESKQSIDCTEGCSYCCFYRVDARADEIALVVDYMKKLPVNIRSLVEEQLQAASEQAKALGPDKHQITNVRCGFLVNDRCSVFPVRPSGCRTHHSNNVAVCEESFETLNNDAENSGLIPSVMMKMSAIRSGFNYAFQDRFDDTVYELNSAVVNALESGSWRKRVSKKKKAFLDAVVIPTPKIPRPF